MKLYKKLLILLVCCLPLFTMVQAQSSAGKQQKKIERKKEAKDAETLKKYQQALKSHAKMQTRRTRKEMKSNLKKSMALASGKKEFFLKRWFTPKTKRK